MNDSQSKTSDNNSSNKEKDFRGKKILPIKTVEQLVTSYFIAEVILEIREVLEEEVIDIGMKNIPSLDIPKTFPEKQLLEDLYHQAAALIKFKPEFVYSFKLAFEEMVKSNFKDDPSIFSYAVNDTSHLKKAFGNDGFKYLEKISLFEHTINVLNKAILLYQAMDRQIGLDVAIIASVLHDFGKSKPIRERLLGSQAANNKRIYKAHAEVSAMYVTEILKPELEKYFQNIPEVFERLDSYIERLTFLVKEHHPSNAKFKRDPILNIVIQADKKAREEEYKKIVKQQAKENSEI